MSCPLQIALSPMMKRLSSQIIWRRGGAYSLQVCKRKTLCYSIERRATLKEPHPHRQAHAQPVLQHRAASRRKLAAIHILGACIRHCDGKKPPITIMGLGNEVAHNWWPIQELPKTCRGCGSLPAAAIRGGSVLHRQLLRTAGRLAGRWHPHGSSHRALCAPSQPLVYMQGVGYTPASQLWAC